MSWKLIRVRLTSLALILSCFFLSVYAASITQKQDEELFKEETSQRVELVPPSCAADMETSEPQIILLTTPTT